MNSRETRRYEMFARVQTFGQDNAADFATGSIAATNFTNLNTIIGNLNTAKAGQRPGRDTSSEVLLDAIRLDIQNITRTAAAIGQTTPGFADAFRPPAQFNPSSLLTTADKFIQTLIAQPALVTKFTAHEMSANFVSALQADRAAYSSDTTQRETKRESGVGNIATVGSLIAQGMQAVTTLDAIMHNKYGSQSDKMASWVSASHIERDAQRGQTPAPIPAPTTPKP